MSHESSLLNLGFQLAELRSDSRRHSARRKRSLCPSSLANRRSYSQYSVYKAKRFSPFAKCNSYGVVLGTGAGLVRETAGLVLGHYFRKRREFVEMVVQAGAGVGIVLFSVFYREAVG